MTSEMPHIPNDDAFCSIPVLDAETLEQLIEIDGGELGLTTEMFGLFLADQPKRLSLLKGAIESNDITSIMEISHAIKGSAGTMGALRLRSVAAVLEGFGKGQVIETTPSHLFGCLESAYIEARDALEKHINKP